MNIKSFAFKSTIGSRVFWGFLSIVLLFSTLNIFTFKVSQHYLKKFNTALEVTGKIYELADLTGTPTTNLPAEIESYALGPTSQNENIVRERFEKIRLLIQDLSSDIQFEDGKNIFLGIKNMFITQEELFLKIQNNINSNAPFSETNSVISTIKENSVFIRESISELIGEEIKYDKENNQKIIQETAQAELLLIFILTVISSIGFLLVYLLTKSITRPIRNLENDFQIISGGKFDHNIVISPNNYIEINSLSRSFINMQTKMKEALHTIHLQNETLEMKVEEKIRENSTMRSHVENTVRLAAIGEMASGMAHEINNPLSIILGNIEYIHKQLKVNDLYETKLKDPIEKIQKMVKRINAIINALKRFSGVGEKPVIEKLTMQNIIDDTLLLCSEKIKNGGVTLQVSSSEIVTHVKGIRPELSEVLFHLLLNAFDAVKNLKSDRWIRLVTSETEDDIRISVIDSGEGIPIEYQNKIMNPFFTTKEVGQGAGLGLSIALGNMNRHNGTVQLDRDSVHTKFDIIFPKVLN